MRAVWPRWLPLLLQVVGSAPACDHPLRAPSRPGLVLVDRPSKLLLLSTPKAGATVATQIMFEAFEPERWARWRASGACAWIHDCRHRFASLRAHKPQRLDPCATCRDPAWSCVALVRDPLDRAVSSYAQYARWRRARAPWSGGPTRARAATK